jgi:hypothetical protein
VNVYLSKSLIGRADRRAAELGMSRSSYFGYAVSLALLSRPVETLSRIAPVESRARVTAGSERHKRPSKKV